MKASATFLAAAFLCGSASNACAQALSEEESASVKAARAKYYNLKAAGFLGLSCVVSFDPSSIPTLSLDTDHSMQNLVASSTFSLTLDEKGRPALTVRFPDGLDNEVKQRASQEGDLLRSLVGGMFQTWASKGLEAPIPAYDSQIEHVVSSQGGYLFSLRVPGSFVQVMTDRDYLVSQIVSVNGRLKEHPVYVASPEGLAFAGVKATDETSPEHKTEVQYEIGLTVVDGLRIPSTIRLRVNDNIDLRFALSGCSVHKGVVVRVTPQ